MPQGPGLCHRDWGRAGIGIPAAGWCWDPSQGLVLEAQLGASAGIPAWVWCWKLSWMPVLEAQLGVSIGIPAGDWCWKPSWVPVVCERSKTSALEEKNPNSEPSILSQYLPIPKKLATLK